MQPEHLSRQFDADLAALRNRVVEMGALVDEQFRQALDALASGRDAMVDEVIKRDAAVNALEVRIDDACAHVIAKRQPAAGDLRMILGVSKIVSELERVGDKARKVARLSRALHATGELDPEWLADMRRIAGDARTLLREALDAFVRSDVDTAVAVIRRNRRVASEADALNKDIVRRITERSGHVAALLDMMALTRAVDRVADHAGDLAEHVVYIVKGTDVRHATIEQIEAEARR